MSPSAEDKLGPAPLDQIPFPEKLTVKVCTPDGKRIHGYALEDDLARHYGWIDILLLTFCGELPTAEQRHGAELALVFAASARGGDAPAHAATASRLCGTEPTALFGIAAVTIAEQIRFELERREDLLAWLANGEAGEPPTCGPDADTNNGANDRDSVERLRDLLARRGAHALAPPATLDRFSALVVLLFRCGICHVEQLITVLSLAGLPAATAEAFSAKGRAFAAYPMNLPRFVYEDPKDG